MSTEDIKGPGDNSISPAEIKMYEQEYKHGADLFQRALTEYSKADTMFAKEEFKDVMDKAMQVLNETARELKRKELLKQNEQIAKDYASFKKSPNDIVQQKLNDDLDSAKGKIS